MKLKHDADAEKDIIAQGMKYLDAVLSFILAGMAREKSPHDVTQIYSYYKEILDLTSLKCQSLLYLKLYQLKRGDIREIHKTALKYEKENPIHRPSLNSTASDLPQPSPGHLKEDKSSTISPDCFTSSGFQSSGINVMQYQNQNIDSVIKTPLPSNNQKASQDHDVIIPHSLYSLLKQQSATLNNLHRCHDFWERAGVYINDTNCKEFFKSLDRKCGDVTFQSGLPQLVEYIRMGLCMLKEEM